jgi:pimeloyl-ACP methyl ester carboxylesterase
MYHDPSVARIDYPNTPEAELQIIAQSRESEARYCWSPYLHSPRLRTRLYRANVPTLVLWGESDTFAPVAYGQQLANALPNASFETIGKAGHFPHIEQPGELAARIERFAATLKSKTAARQMEIAR